MAHRVYPLLLILALIVPGLGCKGEPPGLTDQQLAQALETAIRTHHLFEGKAGAADSVNAIFQEWLMKEGITGEDLERSLEARKREPERWVGLISLLESRRDSLFPAPVPPPVTP